MLAITIPSQTREEMIPVTKLIQQEVKTRGWESGIIFIHCPHTTAGVTINESADTDVRQDICSHLQNLIPQSPTFRHYEGNSDAHIKASIMGAQLFLLVEEGELALGQWQEVYFCEWDGPRTRKLWLHFLGSDCKA